MKACFQNCRVQLYFCKDTAKIRDNKKNRHLFYIIPHFFLRNQNIHLKIFEVSIIICIFAPLVPAEPLNNA
jgi:hypothetical protein